LDRRDTEEKGIQVLIEIEVEVSEDMEIDSREGVRTSVVGNMEGEQSRMEEKMNHQLQKMKELEKKIPTMGRSLSKEHQEEVSWTAVLGRKKRQRRKEGSG